MQIHVKCYIKIGNRKFTTTFFLEVIKQRNIARSALDNLIKLKYVSDVHWKSKLHIITPLHSLAQKSFIKFLTFKCIKPKVITLSILTLI